MKRRDKAWRITVACAVVSAIVGLTIRSAEAAPSDPGGVTTETKAGTASATIDWSSVSGATRYRARAYIGNVAVKVSPILSSSTTKYTFVGLEYKIPYTLKVQAGDASSWGNEVGTTPASTVTPQAASPSAPEKPTVAVIADKKIEAKWTPPALTGGAPVETYQVQLLKKGKNEGDPVTVLGPRHEFTTEDTTSPYSVTVKAVNSMAQISPSSEESDAVVAKMNDAAVVPNPSSDQGSGNSNTGGNNPSRSNDSHQGPLAQAPVVATPSTPTSDSKSTTTTTGATARYSKNVSLKSSTSKKSLLALAGLKTSRKSTVTYSIAASSRKVCSPTKTAIRALKSGTCSVKVTVKTGRQTTSRTIRLVIAKTSKTSLSQRLS